MLVGEQLGDVEDLSGYLFVGLVGQLFDCVLCEVGIDCCMLYLINVVKYFCFEWCGKWCIYIFLQVMYIIVCCDWLMGEIENVCFQVIVCLGVIVVSVVFGVGFILKEYCGCWYLLDDGMCVFVMVYLVWVL